MRNIVILSAVALAGCNTAGMTENQTQSTIAGSAMADAQMTASSSTEYVAMAGASDLYEIESSRLALQQSQNAQIQQFARTMIDHHTRTTNTVMTAARAAGLNPAAPKLMPMQRQMVDRLRNVQGSSFDSMYLSQQRQAHQMALTLHTGFAEDGGAGPLRDAAQSAVPIIEDHIRRLQSMPNT